MRWTQWTRLPRCQYFAYLRRFRCPTLLWTVVGCVQWAPWGVQCPLRGSWTCPVVVQEGAGHRFPHRYAGYGLFRYPVQLVQWFSVHLGVDHLRLPTRTGPSRAWGGLPSDPRWPTMWDPPP